jgi:hypothetical protein
MMIDTEVAVVAEHEYSILLITKYTTGHIPEAVTLPSALSASS